MLYANGKPVGGGGAGGNTNSVELTYAEYLALSDEEKMNGTTYYITDINGDGSQFQPIIYSTEEREIGVWTDGKPLYEKTWDFGSDVVCNSNSWTDTPIIKGDIEKIVDIKAVNNAGTIWDMLGANTDQTYVQVYHNRGSNNAISIRYATLQYTKSTDTAGSGTWTPQGVPAVHYSTDEQVIGTWMGETLYQRSYDFSENPIDLSANSWTNTTASNSGIDKIINNEAMTSDGININWLGANAGTGSYIQLLNIRNSTIGIAYLTIQYTKSS